MTFAMALLNAAADSHGCKVLFTVPFLHFSLILSSHYIPANLLTYQMFWYIKINLPTLLIYFIKLNLMTFQMLQFYLIFDSKDCY